MSKMTKERFGVIGNDCRQDNMTIEEIIRTIEVAMAEVEWEYPLDYAIAFEEAIKILKMQIPATPIIVPYDIDYNYYRCPICTAVVGYNKNGVDERKFNYCHHCGQPLQWKASWAKSPQCKWVNDIDWSDL